MNISGRTVLQYLLRVFLTLVLLALFVASVSAVLTYFGPVWILVFLMVALVALGWAPMLF